MNEFDRMVRAQHTDMFNSLQRLKTSDMLNADQLDPAMTIYGVRVKTTEFGWIVLTRQIFNWRICDCRSDPFKGFPTELSGIARAWCYGGQTSFVPALLAAVRWSGRPDTEPSGWIKSVMDERRHGEPIEGITQE